jgi:hypothetical protein
VTCVTADGVNEHVVPELVLSSPVSAGKPDFRNFMAPTLTDFDDMVRCRRDFGWNLSSAISGATRLLDHAARSIA